MLTCCVFLFSAQAVANGDPLQQAYTGVPQYTGIGDTSYYCLRQFTLFSYSFQLLVSLHPGRLKGKWEGNPDHLTDMFDIIWYTQNT